MEELFMISVELPQLVKGMDEAVVVSRLKHPGDPVKKGETILEVETEKAIVAIDSPCSGVVSQFDCQEDDVVCIGKPLCWICAENSSESEALASKSNESVKPFSLMDAQSAPQSIPVALAAGAEMSTLQTVFGKAAVYSIPSQTPASRSPRPIGFNPQNDVASAQTAFKPRVVTDVDLMDAPICDKTNERCSHASTECSCNVKRSDEVIVSPRIAKSVAMTSIRRTIARRMNLSVQTIPASTIFRKADVSELIKMRLKINRFSNVKASLNDYFTKATVMALALMPELNSSLDGDQIIQYADVNIGMAVDAKGSLYVPVIHQAQNMDILAIAAQTKRLIDKAEQHKLTLEEMANPTFTISNMGALGVEYFTPIILPPQSGILGIGATFDEPVEKDGKWEARKRVGLSYAFDHRIIDGALASKFLKKIIEFLEEPIQLIWKE
ncbi:MAG: 2-oxo acid dehydrogenase subunit E2 [Thermoguttaceae bacterium]|nr:2-oxo acid dehydrogenase subunit E2 [Thermoguttaceae bacterium]